MITVTLKHLLRRTAPVAITLGALLASPIAGADNVSRAVHSFLYEAMTTEGMEINIEVKPSSAQLGPCHHPDPFLTRSARPKPGRMTVGVRCGRDDRSVRYIGVNIQAFGDYPVLSDDIPRDTLIQSRHIRLERGNIGELPRGVLLNREEVMGKVTRRRLSAGSPLRDIDLQEPLVIERGDIVATFATGTGFRIERKGKSMDDGALGDQIRVRTAARKILRGTVIGPGSVEIEY